MTYLSGENLVAGYGGADILHGCSIDVSEGEIAVTRTLLNNVPRRFVIDLCANSSFILNTKDSERHRRFRVLRSKMKCVDNETEVTGIYYPEDINYEDSNKNHNTVLTHKHI